MERERDFQQAWGPSPHGGWVETAAKVGFLVVVVIFGMHEIMALRARQAAEPRLTPAVRQRVLIEGQTVRNGYMAKGGGWSSPEAVNVRNQLLRLREQLDEDDSAGRDQLQSHMSAVVDATFEDRRLAVERADGVVARQMAIGHANELRGAYNYSGIGQTKPGRFSAGVWWLVRAAVVCYLLFVPFVLVIFTARLRRHGASIRDEMIYGWKNVLFSAVVWPLGLENYPRDTALDLRRRRVEAEYRARVGKVCWSDQLTALDQRQIEALVNAPRAELAQRLTEIADVPAAVLWKARFAAYAAVFVGFMLASVSSVRAQGRTPVTENRPVASQVEEPPPVEVHGFLQAELGVPDRPLTIPRVWFWGDAHPVSAMTFRLGADMVGADHLPMLRDAFMRIAPRGSPFSFRLGQMINRAVFMAPPPNQERLIGGPGAARFMSFLDLGAEVAGQHGLFGWALEVMSGTGPNMADANDQKDVMGSVAFGPFGTLRFELAFQAGQQPDGFRTRTAVHATALLGPVTLDALGTHQLMAGHQSWAASGMIGWRLHRALDLAAGYDEMHPADLPTDRVVRAQATAHLLDDHLEVGVAYRWSLTDGYAGLGRVQLSF